MPTIADFATSTQLTETESMIKYILNAANTWGGTVTDGRRLSQAITKSRIYATIEVIKAIAMNRQHGYWAKLATYVEIEHNAMLPGHWGEHGLPEITVEGYDEDIAGEETDPDEIDSYRNDTLGLHTRICGETVPHDAIDSNGMPSAVAGRWSIVNGQLKFTGSACQVPMIRMDEALVATKTPVFALPTIVKLAPLWNLKEGDNLVGIAGELVSAGRADLAAIEGGAMKVDPVSDVMHFQKEL